MNAAIVIPYRGDTEARARAFQVVRALWQDGAWWAVNISDDGAEPFSRAASINVGVGKIKPTYTFTTDVIVIADADSLVPLSQVEKAIKWAKEKRGLVWAYTTYRRLNSKWDGIEWQMANAPSLGCMAIRRECFEKVGGFDKRFRGWGYEDLDFARRCAEHWEHRRVPGYLTHLWHGERREDDSPDDQSAEWVGRNWLLYTAAS